MKKGGGFPENKTFLTNEVTKISAIVPFHLRSPLSDENVKTTFHSTLEIYLAI